MFKDSPFLVLFLTTVFPKQTFMAFGTTALNPEVVNPFINRRTSVTHAAIMSLFIKTIN